MNRSSLKFVAMVVAGLLMAGAFVFARGRVPVAGDASGAHARGEVTVSIDNFTFMSPNLNVPAGTKVTWVNHDDVPHTIVSTEQKFKSKAIDTDESFSYTFAEPGTYPYFCSLHPMMVANIVVTAKK